MTFLLHLLVRVVFFGIAIGFITRRNSNVKVEPRSSLPMVAFAFAVLNTLLYGVLKGALNIGTLFMMFLVVPFIANGILLWLTDKLVKPFKVEGLPALAYSALIVTLVHMLLRLLHL